jgi:hypothetical protein
VSVDDPRVTPQGKGFRVDTGGGDSLHVLDTKVFGWSICQGPNLQFVQADDGPAGFAIGFPDSDSAIEAALNARRWDGAE